MAGRFSCWVIVSGFDSTAFRAREREDLLPTLKQLQRTQPDAVIKWFERGRLWEAPLEAVEALKSRRTTRTGRGKDRVPVTAVVPERLARPAMHPK